MSRLRLERPIHYGNAGLAFSERKPVDDEYLFKPENLKDVWSSVKLITDRYGYAFQFDSNGNVVLAPLSAPHAVLDLSSGGTEGIHPSAYGGTYREYTSGSVTIAGVKGARLDLVVGIGPSFGSWNYTVTDDNNGAAVVASGVIATSSELETFYYDPRQTITGANPCIATVFTGYYGTYTIQLTAADSATKRIDCVLQWHTDPNTPLAPMVLSTDANAVSVQAQSTMGEMRNYVIVVGRRKSVVGDSEKIKQNPNNPDGEFVVQSATDHRSILNPLLEDGSVNPNYIGFTKESLIFEQNVADDEFAAYVAQAFMYRYRMPRPSAPVEHTLLPIVELYDPIYAIEENFQTLDQSQVLYVTGIDHQFDGTGRATTTIETTSYPSYPTYQPREDIDIDAHFGGQPIININISYEGIDGTLHQNLADGAPTVRVTSDTTDIIQLTACPISGNTCTLPGTTPWPPVPGTVYVKPTPNSYNIDNPDIVNDHRISVYPTAQPGWTVGASVLPGYAPGLAVDFTGSAYIPMSDVNEIGAGDKYTFGTRVSQFGALGPVTLMGSRGAPTEVQVWKLMKNGGTTASDGTPYDTVIQKYTITTDRLTKNLPFWYQYDDTTKEVTAFRVTRDAPNELFTTTWLLVVKWVYGSASTSLGFVTNNPYHHFFEPDYQSRSLNLIWNQADGTANYALGIVPSISVSYRAMRGDQVSFTDPYASTGGSPFYDPYTSEIGNLIQIRYDALISGRYRISIRSLAKPDVVVAWLTEPTLDPNDPELHWQFVTAGINRKAFWDGVDQLGLWNQTQSQQYADSAHSAFHQDERPLVGAGYYAWNNEDRAGDTYARRAIISGHSDHMPGGRSIFGHGTFAQWFVQFEVESDYLLALSAQDSTKKPRRTVVTRANTTDTMLAKFNGTPAADITARTQAIIYTYLGRPTGVEVKVSDWSAGAFDLQNTDQINNEASWTSSPTNSATINNKKPIRVRFTMVERPGRQWAGLAAEQTVKLRRLVHLRRHLYDQFVLFQGTNYIGTNTEDRRVVTRRMTNDDHTLEFSDDAYRRGDSFKSDSELDGLEWIFLPSDFKKDFGRGITESLEHNNYLQLEEVPQWGLDNQIAGQRSRLQIAFINDLFYFSVYTQDRSGRYNWCLNRDFVDYSKITTNTLGEWTSHGLRPTDWPDDYMNQHRRTVVCRQWSGETTWHDEQLERWFPASGSTNPVGPMARGLLQFYWADQNPNTGPLTGMHADNYSYYHVGTLELPDAFGPSSNAAQLNNFGNWTWENSPLWVPCIPRDFHGFYLVPPMAAHNAHSLAWGKPWELGGYNWRVNYIYAVVDPRKFTRDDQNLGDDDAALPAWQSPIFSMEDARAAVQRFWFGQSVKPVLKDDNYVMKLTRPSSESTDDYRITVNTLDYQRLDNLVHYEDLRGAFSRGPRPSEQSKKIAPVQPYYVNHYYYGTINTTPAYVGIVDDHPLNNNLPMYNTDVADWFQANFRSEYVWESGTLFPCNRYGVEQLNLVNAELSHLPTPAEIGGVHYDSGAWVGWKDDLTPGAPLATNLVNVFPPHNLYMAIATGPRLPVAQQMIFHLTLVNERRESSV